MIRLGKNVGFLYRKGEEKSRDCIIIKISMKILRFISFDVFFSFLFNFNTDHQLYFFILKGQDPLNCIYLDGVKINRTHKDRFEVDATSRTFFFRTDTEEVINIKFDQISQIILKFKI